MSQVNALGMIAVALLLADTQVLAQDVPVTTFSPPQVDVRANPRYPLAALNNGEEGAVELNYMVDKEGKPFEITVTNATGDEDFREAAVSALQKWTFTPAMVGNEPTVGSMRTMIKFMLGDAGGATRKFISRYGSFQSALQKEPREAAEEAIERLAEIAGNHYENAYVNMARYLFARQYGTPMEQMRYLHAGLSFARDVNDLSYLPRAEVRSARRELFTLQVKNQYFREAMDTFLLLEKAGDTEGADALRPAYAELQALESNDTAYGIPVTLDDAGGWGLKLHKHNVYIEQVAGKVSEFKVRCSQQYVGFAVEPDISYKLPKEWGTCDLEIIGEPGSTFTLVQH